jgi:hypothetical protein
MEMYSILSAIDFIRSDLKEKKIHLKLLLLFFSYSFVFRIRSQQV